MAQYWTSWDGLSTGGVPAGWTYRYGSTATWVLEGPGVMSSAFETGGTYPATDERVLDAETSSSVFNMLTWDLPGQPSEVDVIIRTTAINAAKWTNELTGVAIRADTVDPQRYAATFINGTHIRQYTDMTSNDAAVTYTPDQYEWMFLRIQATGGLVRSTASQTLAQVTGATPTKGWLHSVTDPDDTRTGYVGLLVKEKNGKAAFDWIGVGTGGDLPPTSGTVSGTAPGSFVAAQAESVELTWNDSGGPYTVRRDGTIIASALAANSYFDNAVTVGTTYSYTVEGADGVETAAATVAVTAGSGGVNFLSWAGTGWVS